MRKGWTCGGLAVVLLALFGCGPPQDAVVTHLAVNRSGWDTLDVDVRFARRVRWGGERPVVPAATTIYLFNAAYDTLYADTSRHIPVPDADLGDGERIMVEVCGTFEAVTVCEQDGVSASPKRIDVDHDVVFSEDGTFERGRYDLRFRVERQVFGGDAWEPLRRRDGIHGYLLAYVGRPDRGAVQVPFTSPRGRFDLTRQANYDDFRYYLKSTLMDTAVVPVFVDIYAGLSRGAVGRLATVEQVVHARTTEERGRDVRYFAEQAARRILDALHAGPPVRIDVDDWQAGPFGGSYAIEVDMEWRSGRGVFGRRYAVGGVLELREDGQAARFRRTRANERALHLWRARLGSDALDLGTLDARSRPAPPATSVADDEPRPGW